MSAKVKRCLRKSYRIVSGEEEKKKRKQESCNSSVNADWLLLTENGLGGKKNEEQEMDEQIPLVIVDQ